MKSMSFTYGLMLCAIILQPWAITMTTVEMKQYWPANVHIVGRDCSFSYDYLAGSVNGVGFAAADKVYGWILFSEDKMSKSKGNVVYHGTVR